MVAVGYMMLKSFGDLLGHAHTDDIRVPKQIPLSINSPVVSLRVIDRGTVVRTNLAADVTFDFKLLTTNNRTNPFCVFWEEDMER